MKRICYFREVKRIEFFPVDLICCLSSKKYLYYWQLYFFAVFVANRL